MVPTIAPPSAVTRPTTTVSSAGPAGLNPQTNCLAAGSNRSRCRGERAAGRAEHDRRPAGPGRAALRATSAHTCGEPLQVRGDQFAAGVPARATGTSSRRRACASSVTRTPGRPARLADALADRPRRPPRRAGTGRGRGSPRVVPRRPGPRATGRSRPAGRWTPVARSCARRPPEPVVDADRRGDVGAGEPGPAPGLGRSQCGSIGVLEQRLLRVEQGPADGVDGEDGGEQREHEVPVRARSPCAPTSQPTANANSPAPTFPHMFMTLITMPTRRPPKSMQTEYPLTPPNVPQKAPRLMSRTAVSTSVGEVGGRQARTVQSDHPGDGDALPAQAAVAGAAQDGVGREPAEHAAGHRRRAGPHGQEPRTRTG